MNFLHRNETSCFLVDDALSPSTYLSRWEIFHRWVDAVLVDRLARHIKQIWKKDTPIYNSRSTRAYLSFPRFVIQVSKRQRKSQERPDPETLHNNFYMRKWRCQQQWHYASLLYIKCHKEQLKILAFCHPWFGNPFSYMCNFCILKLNSDWNYSFQ